MGVAVPKHLGANTIIIIIIIIKFFNVV